MVDNLCVEKSEGQAHVVNSSNSERHVEPGLERLRRKNRQDKRQRKKQFF